jgi:hypothetical protein
MVEMVATVVKVEMVEELLTRHLCSAEIKIR